MANLKDMYRNTVKPKLLEELGLKNPLAVPSLEKIVVSMGVGEAKDNPGVLEKVLVNLSALSGQKAVVTKAKKSVANFKLSKGQPIGAMVTLRGERMYEFLERLISVVLPKVRDFRGLSSDAFDSRGNYSLGLRELIIFPEVDYKNVDKARGLGITIVTDAKGREAGKKLLEMLGMPFRKEN